MIKKVLLSIALIAALGISACTSYKVLQKDADTTVVRSSHRPTKFEAKLAALEGAKKELGGEVVETKEAECQQELDARGTAGTVRVDTDWRCVVFAKRK